MLYLPKPTEINNSITVSSVSLILGLDKSESELLEHYVAKFTIVNEISRSTSTIAVGDNIKAFFAIHVKVKSDIIDKQVLDFLKEMINGHLIFILEYDCKYCLVVYYNDSLIHTPWMDKKKAFIDLVGNNLDEVWKNVILTIGQGNTIGGQTVAEVMDFDEKRKKYEDKITLLKAMVYFSRDIDKKVEYHSELIVVQKEYRAFMRSHHREPVM